MRLLIAASGTGGHLFPALAVAEKLPDYHIEWLGVPDRLEQTLIPNDYELHTIAVEGLQKPLGLNTLFTLQRLLVSIFQVRQLIKSRKIDAIFTTGGYIASPAIIAARLEKIPVILHEANFIPGKVTLWFSRWCNTVALGFQRTDQYFPQQKTIWVGTPVRQQFRHPQPLDLPIPAEKPLIVVVGGSQGAVAINQLVRQCALHWLEAGAFIVHLTGEKDPEANILKHPQYFSLPFYENMAGLLQRANLAISRAGAGTLSELALTQTPAILIPYPYAAEDHQTYNAQIFTDAGAAYIYPQSQLNSSILDNQVQQLLRSPQRLEEMAINAGKLAIIDSAERLADLLRQTVNSLK